MRRDRPTSARTPTAAAPSPDVPRLPPMTVEATAASEAAEPSPVAEIERRLAQQALVAAFGRFALGCRDLDALLHEACRIAAEGLGVGFAKALERRPGEPLLVRAGIGWRPGVVGHARVGADLESPAGYALRTGEPVISNHLEEERRFRTPALMAEHGVRRAINVVVRGAGEPFGVLEADSRDPGAFSPNDIHFLEALAHTLGVAIDRERASAESERLNAALLEADAHHRRAVALNPQMAWTADAEGRLLAIDERWRALTGRPPEEAPDASWAGAAHPDDRGELAAAWRRAVATGEPFDVEHRVRLACGSHRWMRSRAEPWRGPDGRTALWYGATEDVHDRKLAERRRRADEETRRLALDAGGLGLWDHDLASGLVVWDERTRAILDWPDDEPPSLDRLRELVHPDDRARLEAAVAAAIDPGRAALYDEVVRVRRARDGELRWLAARARALFEGEGDGRRAARFLGTLQDVTERRRTEARLVKSEARFRAVQETSIDGFMLLESLRDEAGRIVDFRWAYANEAAERIMGRPRAWFAGRRMLQENPGNRDEGLFDAYVRVVETGEPWTRELSYRRDGLDLDVRLAVAKAGDGFAVTIADLSERRRAEERLRESEARFAAIVNSVDQMIWSTRPDGFHDFYNQRWYDYTGVPEGSTDGEGWSGLFHPDDQPRAWGVWQRSLETGEPYHIEYRLRHRSGAYRWVIGRALPVRDEAGRIRRWFGTCTDVHDLKMAEEARELIARELAHRIKNIFAVVTSLVALSAKGDPAARPFAQAVRARIDALARAHDYVSPGGARREGAQTVQGLLDALLASYRDEGRGRVAVSGPDAPVAEKAATALALVVHELATNAIKHGALSSPEGRVLIDCEREPETYRIRWRERGGPRVAGPPSRQGFGTVMSERAAAAQLGARVEHDWAPEGLSVSLTLPLDRLAH